MKRIGRFICLITITSLILITTTGCFGGKNNEGWDESREITVVSREDGSGTRGAFVELTGVEEKDSQGVKWDNTTVGAIITNNTEVMLSTVSGDKYGIGYVSLGSMKDTVKAVEVEGVKPTAENIKNGTYRVSRAFNIATKTEVSDITQDFINYVLSEDGQRIVEDSGYVSVNDNAKAFESNGAEGKVVVAGSSSVAPVMEKLKEAYEKINAKAKVEVQQSDSSTGMEAAIKGACDIGLASRELKESELSAGLVSAAIAKDGITIIVNNKSEIDNLTLDQIKRIYTGEITEWSEIK